ncbi:MAG: hypothetical protein GH150_04820 [Hadesarchaea archaeon]|nr:hypothetical protein [Hadesarchaea archaeon]
MATTGLDEAFSLLDGGSPFQAAAKGTGMSQATLFRRYSKHLSSKLDEKKAILNAMEADKDGIEHEIGLLQSDFMELEAKKAKLESMCGPRGMTFERCIAIVGDFEDISAELVARRKTLSEWDEAIMGRGREYDSLERMAPRLKEEVELGKFALQSVQKLYFDTVNKVQAINQQLCNLEQEANERFNVVMVLCGEEMGVRADAERAARMRRENTDQLIEVQEAVQRVKEELKQAEEARDSMLASVNEWIKVKADERVSEAAETLRIRLIALGIQLEKPIRASG